MIITQLLLTLDFMSRKNIVHRDLKPENVRSSVVVVFFCFVIEILACYHALRTLFLIKNLRYY